MPCYVHLVSDHEIPDYAANVRAVVDLVDSEGETFVISKAGHPVACLVPHAEWESLNETVDIMSDADTMAAIAEGEADFKASRYASL